MWGPMEQPHSDGWGWDHAVAAPASEDPHLLAKTCLLAPFRVLCRLLGPGPDVEARKADCKADCKAAGG